MPFALSEVGGRLETGDRSECLVAGEVASAGEFRGEEEGGKLRRDGRVDEGVED